MRYRSDSCERISGETVAERGAVVVSGASSGIGEATALELARAGYTVFAGFRRAADGARLGARGSPQLIPIELDVTSASDVRAAADQVATRLGARGMLRGIVNNAGVLVPGPIELVPIDEFRRQLEVNVLGPLVMIQAFLPLLRRSCGRVVNVGSTSGRVVHPMSGAYCASKFALEVITQVLRSELRADRIHVSMIEPGVVKTLLWPKALAALDALATSLDPRITKRAYAAELQQRRRKIVHFTESADDPIRVASAVIAALSATRPKRRYVVGLKTQIRTALAVSLPPSVLEWIRARRS